MYGHRLYMYFVIIYNCCPSEINVVYFGHSVLLKLIKDFYTILLLLLIEKIVKVICLRLGVSISLLSSKNINLKKNSFLYYN